MIRQIFLGLISVSITLVSILDTHAADINVSKIFKIQTYSKNTVDGGYSYDSYGSAVLIGGNQVITNAHVILGANDLPTGNYNLCISQNFDAPPKCKTALKLIRYDEDADLALLQIIDTIQLGTPIKITNRKLILGETVKVYGYPANGGKTITLTEGKISGSEDEHYKIDANIDHGNSGGGAFDKDGTFIGIPYVASVGLSTLGYIIPNNLILDFLAKKGNISEYNKTDAEFLSYISGKNTSLINQKIINPHFTFDGFMGAGFTLEDVNEIPGSSVASYSFLSKSRKTLITISTPYIAGDIYIPYEGDMDTIRESYEKVVTKSGFTLHGKNIDTYISSVGLKKSDGTIDKNIAFYGFDANGITFTIHTTANITESKLIGKAIRLFDTNLRFTKKIALSSQTNSGEILPGYTPPSGTSFQKWCGSYCSYMIILSRNISINLNIRETTIARSAQKDTDFTNFITTLLKYTGIDMEDEKNTVEIKKNAKGLYHLHIISKDSDGSVTYMDQFYKRKDDVTISILSVSMTLKKSDPSSEKQYNTIIDTLPFIGEFPFTNAVEKKFSKN